MSHGFVEEVFGERLGIIRSQGGYHRYDHLADEVVPVRLEPKYLLCSVHEILAHELWNYTLSS